MNEYGLSSCDRFGRRLSGLGLALALLIAWTLGVGSARAGAPATRAAETPPPPPEASSPDANCVMCHTNHNFRGRFANGEIISLYVDVGEFDNSVHGPEGLECIACHPNTESYPHRPDNPQVDCTTCHAVEDGQVGEVVRDLDLTVDLPYPDRRAMTLAVNQECHSCHEEAASQVVDSMHVRAMESGNRFAPVCADCHGSHGIMPPDEPRARIPELCGQCHRSVYSTYITSVHAAAFATQPNNPDVPTCIDCHGVHSVRGPRTPGFHNGMIAVCGECHADPQRMAPYGGNTQVYRTYLHDFHGRMVNLARLANTGWESAEATCFDCHGAHNVQTADDPRALVSAEKVQSTCQTCHPGASERFPQAWLRHQEPTWETAPVVTAVNWAYAYGLIPGVIGGFLLYIGLDARKRWQEKRRRWQVALQVAEQEIAAELAALGVDDDEDLFSDDASA